MTDQPADQQDAELNELRAHIAKLRAAAKDRPQPTPAEAAAALTEAVTTVGVIVCYSTCWACKFDECYDPPEEHPWWDQDDVDHAKAAGQPAPTGKCACHCAKTEEQP